MNVQTASRNTRDQPTPGRREAKHPLDYAIALLLLFTAVGTGVAAWYTAKQWGTARNTLVVSQRGFVTVGKFGSMTSIGDDQKLSNLIIDIPLLNSGNTRTRDLQLLFKCRTSTQYLLEPWGLLHQEKVDHLPQVIGPHADSHIYCSFSKDEILRIKNGSLFGYILGEVTYYDIFTPNDRHITQIAQNVAVLSYTETPAAVFSFITPIGQHNCADEDCPKE